MTGTSRSGPRPGGRSARVHRAILDAAQAQLLAGGYDGLSLAGVAADAGVAETTVYRRWNAKSELAAAALIDFAQANNPMPDTGTLAGDLRAALEQILELLGRPEILRVMRAVAALDDDVLGVQPARRAFVASRTEWITGALANAARRGEDVTPQRAEDVLETLVAPAYLRLLLTGRRTDAELITRSVDAALRAAGAPRPG